MTKSSILLADDDGTFREALQKFLEPTFRIVASVGNGQELVEAAQALAPDVIIADVSMPLLDGLHAVRRIRVNQPDARVVFLTVHEEPAFLLEAEKSGAVGYVLKRCAASDLIPAIRAVLQGSLFIRSPALEEFYPPDLPPHPIV